MLYPSINKIRKKVDSRYTLVILAAQRARDLVDGKPVLTESENGASRFRGRKRNRRRADNT